MLRDLDIEIESKRNDLIRPFNLSHLQPHSYDATLHDIIKIASYDPITKERSWTPKNCFVTPVELQPYQFALASTNEYFKLSQNLVGFVQGKSSIGRNGLQIENAGLIDAGFEGMITLELFNMAPWPIKLQAGMAICQIHFTEASAPVYKNYSSTGHYNKQVGPTEAVYKL
jgi:dCTP deaminase